MRTMIGSLTMKALFAAWFIRTKDVQSKDRKNKKTESISKTYSLLKKDF